MKIASARNIRATRHERGLTQEHLAELMGMTAAGRCPLDNGTAVCYNRSIKAKGGARMKLLFKQRFFSWFDSYDIFDASGQTVFTVRGELAWGHQLRIYDAAGSELGLVKQRVLTFMPKFELYFGSRYAGCIRREWTLFKPSYTIECNGWHVDGSFTEWDYRITAADGRTVATIGKELFNWTDTYTIDIERPEDALCVLMLVLAIDAEKCSRS